MATKSAPILVARVGAPHGVRGEVRLTAFGDDPQALIGYGALAAADGRRVRITGLKLVGGRLIARLEGVTDRDAAQALTNLDLYVDRERLPPPEDEDEFYHADLIGLAAVTVDGAPLGTVVAVPNYGAGDLLEIAPPRGASLLVPFTRAVVPTVDLAGGRVLVDPPPGLLDPPKPGERQAEAEAAAQNRRAAADTPDGDADPVPDGPADPP